MLIFEKKLDTYQLNDPPIDFIVDFQDLFGQHFSPLSMIFIMFYKDFRKLPFYTNQSCFLPHHCLYFPKHEQY